MTREVPVETIVYQDRIVDKIVEVIKQVPVERVVLKLTKSCTTS